LPSVFIALGQTFLNNAEQPLGMSQTACHGFLNIGAHDSLRSSRHLLFGFVV
jgi:hypothetical protein